jgi:predicted ATPase
MAQFIIATHSPILMAYPDACIYACTSDGLSQVAYEDTEHFQVSRDFLANPERMLRVLLER